VRNGSSDFSILLHQSAFLCFPLSFVGEKGFGLSRTLLSRIVRAPAQFPPLLEERIFWFQPRPGPTTPTVILSDRAFHSPSQFHVCLFLSSPLVTPPFLCRIGAWLFCFCPYFFVGEWLPGSRKGFSSPPFFSFCVIPPLVWRSVLVRLFFLYSVAFFPPRRFAFFVAGAFRYGIFFLPPPKNTFSPLFTLYPRLEDFAAVIFSGGIYLFPQTFHFPVCLWERLLWSFPLLQETGDFRAWWFLTDRPNWRCQQDVFIPFFFLSGGKNIRVTVPFPLFGEQSRRWLLLSGFRVLPLFFLLVFY